MPNKPILVVDDTSEIRDLIADFLSGEGYAVECACNGADALTMMERTPPALVLLDLNMPVLDGWGFARALDARALHVPILLLTAARDAVRSAREIGAVGCIRKPFELPELLGAVEREYRAATM